MLIHKGDRAGKDRDAGGTRRVLRRVLSIGFEALLGVIAAVIIAAALGAGTGWWHFEVIESGSMTPALRVGGVAVVQAEPTSAVHVGQILALHPPGEASIVRIHRVIAVSHRGNQVWVRTKGDANKNPDPGPIRLVGKTAYAEHFFIPYAGYFGVWLYKHPTRVVLEVVLFVLIVAGGLVLIWGKEDEERPAHAARHRRAPAATGEPAPAAQIASPAQVAAHRAAAAPLASLGQAYAASGSAPDLSAAAEIAPVANGEVTGEKRAGAHS